MSLVVHGEMLLDNGRNRALAAAIEEVVRPGDVVADVGAGTGILAMLAARAGAAQVYAIERAPIAAVARALLARNGLDDVVQLVHTDLTEFAPPARVDVVLCETLGMACLDEGFRATMADARHRLLRPGGRLLPADVTVHVAPVRHGAGRARLDQLDSLVGLDFAPFGDLVRAVHRRVHLDASDLLAPAKTAWLLDCHTMEADETLTSTLSFRATRDAELGGFAMWFDAALSPSVRLSNWGNDPENHWGQAFLPVTVRPVAAGERIELAVSIQDSPGQFRVHWRDGGTNPPAVRQPIDA
ncbi:methyltransferase domain-containing protein [Catellatospora chokoriensis]|nr:methyltransferase domain-containing protein [Catellatospora chokoriensis]